MKFYEWARTESPADVIDLNATGRLLQLVNEYGGVQPYVLHEVAGQAYDHGAQMAVAEHRYIDADYRDEHSRFYSKAFRRYPSVAMRLHFFKEKPPLSFLDPDQAVSFDGLTYLGYTVIRPVPGAPVGRTVLRPPSNLAPYVTCKVEDKVNLLGEPLVVEGSPFIAQDAQLGVCAHTTAWITAYYHHLVDGERRYLPGEIAEIVPSEVGLGRPTPSTGLSIDQIVETCNRIGLPALVYRLGALPRGENLFRIACRYLNSGLPVTVAAASHHAFVLVGYRRMRHKDGSVRIHFIRQDDEVGPYQVVENPWWDLYRPWDYLVVPLPRKVYIDGELAEALGGEQIQAALRNSKNAEAQQLLSQLQSGEATLRSTAIRSNEFKSSLRKRKYLDTVAGKYQRMQMSRWIWVIEVTLHEPRDRGEACVKAEAVIDATDHLRDRHVLALRIPGFISRWLPDFDKVVGEDLPSVAPVASVAKGDWTIT